MKIFPAILAMSLIGISGCATSPATGPHLYYLHGCCVKNEGDPKVNAYNKIVQQLRDDGFNVHFGFRYASVGDNDAAVQQHAARIAREIRELIGQGTAPEQITVAGYSLGSMTALVASGLIANPKVNFVLLAGCPVNSKIKVNIDYSKAAGRILSVYDNKDVKFGSCKGRVPDHALRTEIVLDSGEGHNIFKKADGAQMRLWKDPLVNWAKGI